MKYVESNRTNILQSKLDDYALEESYNSSEIPAFTDVTLTILIMCAWVYSVLTIMKYLDSQLQFDNYQTAEIILAAAMLAIVAESMQRALAIRVNTLLCAIYKIFFKKKFKNDKKDFIELVKQSKLIEAFKTEELRQNIKYNRKYHRNSKI